MLQHEGGLDRFRVDGEVKLGGRVGEECDHTQQEQAVGRFVVVGFHGVDEEVGEEHVADSEEQRDKVVEDLSRGGDTL